MNANNTLQQLFSMVAGKTDFFPLYKGAFHD
jgi:hypothetical protein